MLPARHQISLNQNVTMQLEVVCCLKFVLCVTLRSCVLSARAGHQSVCWCLWSLSDSDGFRQTGRCRLGRHPEPSRQACAKAIAEWVVDPCLLSAGKASATVSVQHRTSGEMAPSSEQRRKGCSVRSGGSRRRRPCSRSSRHGEGAQRTAFESFWGLWLFISCFELPLLSVFASGAFVSQLQTFSL